MYAYDRWWCVSPVDLACLRNHLLHASRDWYCSGHPLDTAVGRDRNHYSFSSIRAVVYGFSRNYYKIKNVSCEIEDFIETHLCKLRGILRSCMKQNKDAVWSLVQVLLLDTGVRADPQSTRTHMISYVCTWGLSLLIVHRYTYVFHFFRRYVGTW